MALAFVFSFFSRISVVVWRNKSSQIQKTTHAHVVRRSFAKDDDQSENLNRQEVELDVEVSDTIVRIKERMEEKEGIPPIQQRLIFGGKQMHDEKTAKDYNIEGGSVIHMVLALRGGGCV